MVIDFGRAASDYARHRAGFPDGFFERLFADGSVHKGNVVLDLGAAPVLSPVVWLCAVAKSADWIIPPSPLA